MSDEALTTDSVMPPALVRRIVTWAAGLAATLIAAGFIGFVTWLTSMYHEVRDHGQKIAVLESQGQAQERRLEKIEQKIDRLIELVQRQKAGN